MISVLVALASRPVPPCVHDADASPCPRPAAWGNDAAPVFLSGADEDDDTWNSFTLNDHELHDWHADNELPSYVDMLYATDSGRRDNLLQASPSPAARMDAPENGHRWAYSYAFYIALGSVASEDESVDEQPCDVAPGLSAEYDPCSVASDGAPLLPSPDVGLTHEEPCCVASDGVDPDPSVDCSTKGLLPCNFTGVLSVSPPPDAHANEGTASHNTRWEYELDTIMAMAPLAQRIHAWIHSNLWYMSMLNVDLASRLDQAGHPLVYNDDDPVYWRYVASRLDGANHAKTYDDDDSEYWRYNGVVSAGSNDTYLEYMSQRWWLDVMLTAGRELGRMSDDIVTRYEDLKIALTTMLVAVDELTSFDCDDLKITLATVLETVASSALSSPSSAM